MNTWGCILFYVTRMELNRKIKMKLIFNRKYCHAVFWPFSIYFTLLILTITWPTFYSKPYNLSKRKKRNKAENGTRTPSCENDSEWIARKTENLAKKRTHSINIQSKSGTQRKFSRKLSKKQRTFAMDSSQNYQAIVKNRNERRYY